MTALGDAGTVAWKEWRELVNRRGSSRTTLLTVGLLLLIFGVIQPYGQWHRWFDSPLPVLFWSIIPAVIVINVVADSFAGERERHTLETLLATRLSDLDILLGKLAACVAWAWGLCILSSITGAITVDIVRAQHGLDLAFYDPTILAGGLTLGLLVALLFSAFGILVSLRASSVRLAQQVMGFALAAVIGGGAVVLVVLPKEVTDPIFQWLATHSLAQAFGAGALVLLVIDAALLAWSRAWFRRARLILD